MKKYYISFSKLLAIKIKDDFINSLLKNTCNYKFF